MRYRVEVIRSGGMALPRSVAPFILRGVTVGGIDAVMASQSRREAAWQRLADILDLNHLEEMSETVAMSALIQMGHKIVDGDIRGRVVVNVNQ